VIVLPPGLPRRFAAVAARCVVGKPAGPPPPVVCRTADGELTVSVRLPNGVVLSLTAETDSSDAFIVMPFEVLTALSSVRDRVELRLRSPRVGAVPGQGTRRPARVRASDLSESTDPADRPGTALPVREG
jgi:hypothetical protein